MARICCLLLLALTFVAQRPSSAADVDPAELERIRAANAQCLACHSEAGLANPQRPGLDLDILRGLLVDVEAFHSSNHGQMDCKACHTKGFEEFPHAEAEKAEIAWCDECHTRAFLMIEEEFANSVHAQEAPPDTFTCVTCHDPHVFLQATHFSTTRAAVAQDNAMCLQCHGSADRFGQVTLAAMPPLMEIHSWLPNIAGHWGAVRCVECHTQESPKLLSHEILGADRAERNCVACHSVNSTLRVRLYRHLVEEEREQAGFLNSAILNEAYVIGATRNRLLDVASFVILGVVILGLAGHGALRAVAALKRRRRHG